MLGRIFGHEFHALLIFQKFLITDDFAALFRFGSPGMYMDLDTEANTGLIRFDGGDLIDTWLELTSSGQRPRLNFARTSRIFFVGK